MTEQSSNERVVQVVGIDLATRSVHGDGVDERGQRVISKTFTRTRLRECMANLPACTVAMAAWGSAPSWARTLRPPGHEVRRIAPPFVQPVVKSNHNDAVDAAAIGAAAQRPNLRCVAVQRVEPQDIQAMHRLRRLAVERRTAQINPSRGRRLGDGIELPQGRAAVSQRRLESRADGDHGLSARFRAAWRERAEALRHRARRVDHDAAPSAALAHSHPQARPLLAIPGLGAQGAPALGAAVGADPRLFQHGRGRAAWLGLGPRPPSPGGRDRWLGIRNCGEVYRRQGLIHGARAGLRWVERQGDPTSRWATALQTRRHPNGAVVAMANQSARLADAVMTTDQPDAPALSALVAAGVLRGAARCRATADPPATPGSPPPRTPHPEWRSVHLTVMA